MTNIIYYEHFYRYKQKRKDVKDLIENDNLTQAQTLIEQFTNEHTSFYGQIVENSPDFEKFNSVDVRSMKHALKHLLKAKSIPTNDPIHNIQKQATIDALNEIY